MCNHPEECIKEIKVGDYIIIYCTCCDTELDTIEPQNPKQEPEPEER